MNPEQLFDGLYLELAEATEGAHRLWLQIVHPDDRDRANRIIQAALDSAAALYELEYRIIRPSNNATRWIFARVYIERDDSGRAVRLAGAHLDVTERKIWTEDLRVNEARLRTLADSVPQLIWTNDASGVANYFNQRWYEYSGLSYEESFGLGWQAIVHPDDAPASTERWNQAVSAAQVFDTEYRLRGRDGSYRWFIGRNVPLKDDANNIQGWFGSATDIEELKRAQQTASENEARYRAMAQDLSQAQAALVAADKQKDQFIATLAHELRNPLAPVRSAMQLISMIGTQDPQVLWALDVVNRQTQGMTRLIDDLMDVSRISQNKLSLQRSRVDLGSVLRDAMETSRPLMEQQRQILTVHLPHASIQLNGDQMRLAQVFANLLDNAAKYTEPGGSIGLSARVDGDHVEVRIRDTGIGIAPEHLANIFDLFAQVRTSRDRAKGGLGIGLSLVKQLVEMHNGTITAASAGERKGSEFTVRLPLSAQVPVEKNTAGTGESDNTPLAGTRVLVVDDNVDAADAFKKLLEREGSVVHAVYDGAAALHEAQDMQPDVVLMDIGLPTLTGHEVASRIRAEPWGKRMILIAVSGWGNEEEKRRSYAAGFERHLVKPVEPRRLMGVMTELLKDRDGSW